jgi:sporulation protein YlmC with PRC-barrel domain
MDHPIPGLKYVNAEDLDQSGAKFAGADVSDVDGEKLGEVEGFVIDVAHGRPRHIAVGAGWFIHKRFLLPIGHATLGADGVSLVADVTKERVKRFPGFDKNEFERLTADEMSQLDASLANACIPTDGTSSNVDDHFRVPAWWR